MSPIDPEMRLVAAKTISVTVVWRAFLDGFRDDLVPVEIDEEPFAALLATQHIDLSASCVALDRSVGPAGIRLLAIRERDGWCGGFGVNPAWPPSRSRPSVDGA